MSFLDYFFPSTPKSIEKKENELALCHNKNPYTKISQQLSSMSLKYLLNSNVEILIDNTVEDLFVKAENDNFLAAYYYCINDPDAKKSAISATESVFELYKITYNVSIPNYYESLPKGNEDEYSLCYAKSPYTKISEQLKLLTKNYASNIENVIDNNIAYIGASLINFAIAANMNAASNDCKNTLDAKKSAISATESIFELYEFTYKTTTINKYDNLYNHYRSLSKNYSADADAAKAIKANAYTIYDLLQITAITASISADYAYASLSIHQGDYITSNKFAMEAKDYIVYFYQYLEKVNSINGACEITGDVCLESIIYI